MAVVIPIVADVPDFDLQVELDGTTYTLEFQWNERDEGWYLTTKTAEDDIIVAGRRVVLDMPLLSRFADDRLPDGVLVAIDTSGTGAEPGYEDLGRRVLLLYHPRSEIPVT